MLEISEEAIARDAIAELYGDHALAHAPMIDRLRRAIEFNGFAFSGLDIDHCHAGRGLFLATNLPEGLIQAYRSENFADVDPIARSVTEQRPVVRWQDVKDDLDLANPQTRRLLQLLDFYSISPRTIVSFWSRGEMYGTATFTREKPYCSDELAALTIFARAVHEHLAQPVVQAINRRLGLTKGEMLCLRAAAEGMTSDEMAASLNYSTETVNTYLKSATRKLNAGNRTQAIAQAIRRDIIQ